MMTIQHFNPDFLLTKENEFLLWQRSATLPTRGSSIYALAILAKEQGIPSKIIVEEPDYKFPGYRFKAYKKAEIEVAAYTSELFHDRAKELNIPIEECNFKLDEVKKYLEEGKLVMLRLIVGIMRNTKSNRRNPHYVLIKSAKLKNDALVFEILDSKKGKLLITEQRLKDSFEAVKECKRDNRMIVFG